MSSGLIEVYIDNCISFGAPARKLYELVPGGEAGLVDPGRRFPADLVPRLLNLAAEETGIDSIGLKVGAKFRPASLMEVGYALAVARTIEEALDLFVRFQALGQEAVRMRFEMAGEECLVRCERALPGRNGQRRLIEAVFAGYLTVGRALLRDPGFPASRIQFRHRDPGPAVRAACEEVFGCAVRFGAPEDVMVLPAEAARRPLAGSNPELLKLLVQRLEGGLASLRDGMSLRDRVTSCIHRLMPRGQAGIGQTAALLGMSERTLRRHLAADGVRYVDLVESARREAAELYLREGKLSQVQIADALGYGDQSAFVRAFKGWHGTSPGAWQRGLSGPG